LKTIEKCELLIGLDFGDDFDLYSAFNSPSQQITVTLEARAYSDCNATTELILSPFPFTQTFTIKRDQPEQLYKTDITTFHTNYLIGGNPNLNPARAIKVKITSVSIPAPLTAIASSYLRLKASFTEDFKVWPDFLNQALNVITLNALSTPSASNPVTFTWTPCGYFENYQFQLLRLYNNDPANTSQSSVTSTVDWSKALSIVTESATPSLTITVAEGTGYYIWRVRPMGDFFPGGIGDVLNWGDWNSDAPADGVTLNFTDPASLPSYAFWYNQFDDDKNWIYSRTFTEGNPERGQQFRVSEQITYANGLQQVKQNQAHLTSQGKILVSQTIQDFSGRPALTTMAAPLARNFFDYEEGLCTESGDLYTASKFDNNANFDDPLPMSGTIESYYSNNNGDVTIPPSEQYPFTRTLWFRDGTNRVKEQGGVGPSHRIGSTHTVRTRYAGAAEEELIRIFGDEAPSAESVYKIINADPNNTVTASYIAKEGQTIATCLVTSGGSPLQPLPSATDPAFTVTRTIPPPLPKDDYLSSSTTLDLSNGGAIAWNYSLTPELLTSVCNSSCSSCDYKVEFWLFNISDPDDNTFPRKGPAPGDPEIIISPSGVCTTSTYTFSGSWTGLDPGTYLVERRVFTGLLNTDNIPYIEEKIQNDMDDYETGIRSNSTLQNIFAYLDLNDAEGLKLYLCSLKSLAGQPCTGTDDTYTIPATCCDIQVPVVYFLSHQEPFYDVPVEAQFTFTYDDACAGSYSSQKLTIAISGLDAPFQVTINDPFASGDPAFYVADAIAQEINSLFSSTHHDLAATAQSNLNGTATIYFTGFLGNAPTVLYFTIIYSYTCSFFPFVTETYFNQPDINFSPAASFPYPNGGNGAFNAMITHMINDDGFDCSQLYKCWNTLIAAYPYLAYKDPVELNGTPFTDKNPDFNLMETFLNCARADAAANCGYTGISNCPYGNCETADPLNGYGYGYLEYAYKYFHYDETNRSLPCETLIVETYTASPYVYPAAISDIASTPPWSAFASGDNCPPEPPGSSGPNTPWLDLYACANAEGNIISAGALPDACSPGNLAADPQGCTDAMITETENKCKEICDDRHDGFVTSLINLNHDNQIFVTGHDDQGDDQQLITFAQDNYTLGTTDIADIYCTANLLLEQCKTKCTLSPVDLDGDGDFDRIGSDAEIEAIKEAMTYTYELEFPSAGSCSAGFTYVSGSADAEEVIVEYLNNMLEEFRSSLSYPGTGEGGWFSLYDLFYNLNPGLTGLCGLEDQTASDPGSKVFVHPDKPSFFTVGPCGGGGIPQICNWGKFSPNETLLLCYDATTTLTPPAFFINATYLWSTGETASSALIGPFSQSTVTDPCEVVFVHITNADNPGEVVTYYYGITLNDCSAPTGDCCLYYIDGMSQADLPSKSGREALIQPGRDTARIAFPKPFSEPPLVTVDSASAPCTVDSVTATHCILRATDTLGRFAFLTITEKNIEAVEGSVSQGQFVARIAFPDTLTIVPRLTILQSDVLASAAKADTAGFLLIASEKKGLNATVGICDDLSLSGTETIPAGTTLYHVDFTFIPPVTSFLSPPIVMVPCSASVITSGFYPQNVTTTGFDIVVMNSAVSHTVCWTAESRCTTSVTLLCHDFCLDAPCDPVCIRYFPIDMPIGDAITITYITCEEMSSGYIKNDLESQIARCLQTQEAALREQYRLKCATPTDQATVSATLQYHHYTLFYYDRAGNLVKTVPPAGVRFTDAGGNTVDQRSEHNDHKLKTQYAYNSIKQLVRQETPDGGETFFVYDLKGQLRFSQNAQQRIDNVYSYTKYDQLGRIIEVGKSIENAGDFGVSSVYSSFETWAQVTVFPNAGLTNSEITFTEYSLNTGIAYNPNLYINLPQQNLQNRVSHTFTDEDGDLTTLTGQRQCRMVSPGYSRSRQKLHKIPI
ncbi:MAG: hypothetical protein HYY40_05420, partial [Bacteroidetes bacterium]|nr:hypothetical protein [Bacteroidota bacterium]